MLRKEITFTDFNGVERTMTYYFNMTQTELAELDLDAGGVLREKLNAMIEKQDAVGLARFFKEIIVRSYGEKSDDGLYFEKGDNFSFGRRFTTSPAFDKLFTEILSDPTGEAATAFIYGIVPADIAAQAKANTTPKITVGDDNA